MSRIRQFAGLSGSAAIVATALVAVPSAQAFDFKLSGQVNRAILAVDNGESSDVGFVDNHASISRFGFTGSQEINSNLKVGFKYVEGLGGNQSSDYNVNHGSGSGVGLQNRQANVYLQGAFGKLTLGKQDGAANSTSKVDLSGLTDLGGGTDSSDYFGSVTFQQNNGDNGPKMKQVYSNFDALSRVNAIRYDTPVYGGFTVAVSLDEGRAVEVAPRYKRKFDNGITFAAAADYVNSGQRNKDELPNGDIAPGGSNAQFNEYGGSASILLASGLNFTAQYKKRNFVHGGTDPQTYFGGVGYIFGKNHVQGFFGQTDDLYTNGSRARNYGVAYRYDLLKSVNLYASYHHLTADDLNLSGGSPQDINVVFSGIRVKFF